MSQVEKVIDVVKPIAQLLGGVGTAIGVGMTVIDAVTGEEMPYDEAKRIVGRTTTSDHVAAGLQNYMESLRRVSPTYVARYKPEVEQQYTSRREQLDEEREELSDSV